MKTYAFIPCSLERVLENAGMFEVQGKCMVETPIAQLVYGCLNGQVSADAPDWIGPFIPSLS